MEILAIIVSIITLFALGLILLKLKQPSQTGQNDQAIGLIQQQMDGIHQEITKLYTENQNMFQKVDTNLSQKLHNVDESVNSRLSNVGSRLDNAAKIIGDIKQKLGEVQETNKRIEDIGQDISSLQDILRAPKIRGGIGELFLSDLLKQVLPISRYKLQHYFKSREAVDAVIILKEGMVPVDSKFPLENFKKVIAAKDEAEKMTAKKQFIRDVKKHIDAIASKYILPDEGTFDFALMYIPAENVYYETIIKDENLDEEKSIFQYAMSKKVLPTSPNSFYAYLQTILLGLRGMKIEAQAQDILRNLARLAGDFNKVVEDFSKIGTHIKNLNAAYENTDKRISRFGGKLESLEETDAAPLLET
ncbi:hypothetical protein A2291_00210 [candidate division WOR-1 bacterium RIFOXYB2_FULL_42_35]|uniref:DNA recombination protein RmuC n=1 Tax=candidate division WOR-1 bacterium RIFOXYC2_FULL_41_25 TaxID=1802586 RepID=A0A1F4TM83_UNCSA|nr:MAG: hypothetical protein A2247_05730 [candidate division WOR-1 bacterium RIFOXYA2_FULL_41_14]OGC24138.1 MAG: hypothetical protein A2291_00210 [candidate division WOR-1 bacterium RIFOXYB2_FULL_42_35]OGC33825.1 MAG: hypothetical protein A2462_01885 [candidate division WOR-1 bacterium RIFOXYC2_FULL_41_25]